MTKKTKTILISLSLSIPISAAIALPIALSHVSKNKISDSNTSLATNNNNYKVSDFIEEADLINSNKKYIYYYDGTEYNSFDEILKYVNKNNNLIKTEEYLGNIIESLSGPGSNYDDGIISMNKMRKYDRSRVFPAYLDANEKYTSSLTKAQQSFINPHLWFTYYADMNGNLFDSESKAKDSIRNSINPTPVMYYELKDEKKKLNPLSSLDMKLFKKDVYTTIRNQLTGKNGTDSLSSTNYSYSIYDSSTINPSNVKLDDNQVLTSIFSSDFYNKEDNIIQNIILTLLKFIYEKQLEWFYNNASFDVEVELYNTARVGGTMSGSAGNTYFYNYVWDGIDNQYKEGLPISNYDSRWYIDSLKYDEKSGYKKSYLTKDNTRGINDKVTFPKVRINELNQFEIFLDKSKFFSNPYIKVEKYNKLSNDIAQVARINNFRGTNFNVDFRLNSILGAAKGMDFKIFDWGTHDTGHAFTSQRYCKALSFNVNLKCTSDEDTLKNTFNSEKMFTYIYNSLKTTYLNPLISSKEFLVTKIVNNIFNLFKNNFESFSKDIYKCFNDPNWKLTFRSVDSNIKLDNTSINPRRLYTLSDTADIFKSLAFSNPFWVDKTADYKNNKFIGYSESGNVASSFNETFKNVSVKFDNILTENVNGTTLGNIFSQNKNLTLVIEYNGLPLFMMKNNLPLSLNSKNKSDILNHFFANEKPTDDDLNNMINATLYINRSSRNGSYYNTIDKINGNQDYIVDISTENEPNKWSFNYDTKNSRYIQGKEPSLFNLDELDKYSINSIPTIHNRIYDNKYSVYDMNNVNDIIFLYSRPSKEKISAMNMSYREFLSTGNDANLSLYSNKKAELYSTKTDIEMGKAAKLYTSPTPITILRNWEGKIINPGIINPDNANFEDEKLFYTGDAIFDSRETIIENLFKTEISKPVTNKIYYKDSLGQLELIDNEINQIYVLNWDGKTSYFARYDDCWNYFIKSLKTKVKTITYYDN